jgi:hypothetical protein
MYMECVTEAQKQWALVSEHFFLGTGKPLKSFKQRVDEV